LARFTCKRRAEEWKSLCPSKILPQALEERMADFAFSRLCAVFDLGEQRRLDPNAAVCDLFGVWLRFADQWLQPRLQVLRRGGIEAWSTLPA
jgi:hypothetical protein